MTFFSSRKGLQESEASFYLYTLCVCSRSPTTVKESLTAQIERLVQAFFNVALTPDISFVSVIMHSGFAASRSCQNPSAQTLFSTLLFAIASNPSSTQDTDTSPHSRTSIQEPKAKGFPGKVTDQTEREQIPRRISLCTEFPAGSKPQFIKGNILLGSAWEEMISLVSALCTVQIF